MPAHPELHDVYRPEDTLPTVDESDEIQKVGQRVHVPAGSFARCIQVEESSVLTPDIETKWYAPGLGVVKVKEHGEVLALDSVSGPP